MLYIKECKAVSKNIVYWIFIFIMILFFSSQFWPEVVGDLKLENNANLPDNSYNAKPSPLLSPDSEGIQLGFMEAEVPEMIMPNAVASLAKEHSQNEFGGYPFGFYKVTKMSEKELSEIEQIITDITGLSSAEILAAIKDGEKAGKIGPFPGISLDQLGYDGDYSDFIPVIVDYDTFKEKIKIVDKMIGGGSAYAEENLASLSFRPITSEDVMDNYESIIYKDKVSNAYARLYCDYMGIVVSLLAVFVPVAFLLRDRRTRINELIYPREVSSLKLIGMRYLSLVTMTFIPIILISIEPIIRLAIFGAEQNIAIDYLAFVKYSFAWILPSVLVVTSVAFFFTILTDTPIGIIIQFAWSFVSVITGRDLSGLAGESGFAFVIRFNETGNYAAVQEQITAMIINRVSYSVLAIVLLALSVIVYEQKRKGRLDVGSKLRKNAHANKSAI